MAKSNAIFPMRPSGCRTEIEPIDPPSDRGGMAVSKLIIQVRPKQDQKAAGNMTGISKFPIKGRTGAESPEATCSASC